MKSEYKKSILFLQEVVLFAIGIGMALLFWRGRYDTDSFKRTLVGGIGLMIAFFAVFFAEYFNRYVELGESCAKFNSFRVTKGKKAMNMNVSYENILAIQSGCPFSESIKLWCVQRICRAAYRLLRSCRIIGSLLLNFAIWRKNITRMSI